MSVTSIEAGRGTQPPTRALLFTHLWLLSNEATKHCGAGGGRALSCGAQSSRSAVRAVREGRRHRPRADWMAACLLTAPVLWASTATASRGAAQHTQLSTCVHLLSFIFLFSPRISTYIKVHVTKWHKGHVFFLIPNYYITVTWECLSPFKRISQKWKLKSCRTATPFCSPKTYARCLHIIARMTLLLLQVSVQLSWLKALADRHYESCCTHSDNISWCGREASATLMKNQRFRMKRHNRNYANTSCSAAQATKATNESKNPAWAGWGSLLSHHSKTQQSLSATLSEEILDIFHPSFELFRFFISVSELNSAK